MCVAALAALDLLTDELIARVGQVGDRFRGRVMGVRMLAVYGLPLGLMASGALIDLIGYAPTIATLAATGLVFTLLAGITWRASLWHRRVAT